MNANRHRCPSSWKKIEVFINGEVKRSFNLGQFGQITDKLPVAKRRNLKKLEQVELQTMAEPSSPIQSQPSVTPSHPIPMPFALQTLQTDFSLFYDDFSAPLGFDIFDNQSLFYE